MNVMMSYEVHVRVVGDALLRWRAMLKGLARRSATRHVHPLNQ
jgi:hypothetical protein